MHLKINVICFVIICGLSLSHCLLEEPRCSKYDFEERVLEKLIVLDHTVKASLKEMELRIEKHEHKIEQLLTTNTEENKKFKNELVTNMDKTINDHKRGVESSLNTFETNEQMLNDDILKFKCDFQMFYSKLSSQLIDNITFTQQSVDNAITTLMYDSKQLNNQTEETRGEIKSDVGIMIATANARIESEITKIKESVLHKSVAFVARNLANTSPTSGLTLIYQTPIINYGDAYDTSTGIFTAPLAGAYIFSVQMCINADSIINYEIRSASTVYSTTEYGDNIDDVCASVTTVAVLDKGEQVWVKCTGVELKSYILEGDLDSTYWQMFSGVLVSV